MYVETRNKNHFLENGIECRINNRNKMSVLIPSNNPHQVHCRKCGSDKVNNDDSLHLVSIVFVSSPTFDPIL